MDWFLYDNGLHYERINMVEHIAFDTVRHKRQTSNATRHSRKTGSSHQVKIRFMGHAKTSKMHLWRNWQ